MPTGDSSTLILYRILLVEPSITDTELEWVYQPTETVLENSFAT